MALSPISTPPAPVQPTPARDVGAAQRAFFQAALSRAQGATATPPPAPPAPQAISAAQAEETPDPLRGYRPGRLLDMKV